MKLHLTLILLLLGGFLFSQDNQEKKVVGYILNDNNFSMKSFHSAIHLYLNIYIY